MDRRMDGHLEIPPCVLQDIGPLGPLPKKTIDMGSHHIPTHAHMGGWMDRWMDGQMDGWTDGRMNGQMDGRMDKAFYTVMCAQLKKL